MLSKLREAQIKRTKRWDLNSVLDLSFYGNALAGETGEACNIIKKLERERLGVGGTKSTVADLAEELADVVIYLDIIAMKTGIDLESAIKDKFNKTSKAYDLGVFID